MGIGYFDEPALAAGWFDETAAASGWFDETNLSGGAGSYSLVLAQGSYALIGTTTSFRAGRNVTLAQGAYALTGNAQALRKAIPCLASLGTYSLTGFASSLVAAHRIASAQGSYALTGTTTGLKKGSKTTADWGSYSLNGMDAVLFVETPAVEYSGFKRNILPITPGSLVKWRDYYPIMMKPATLPEDINRTDDLGALACVTLTLPEGVAGVDYWLVAAVSEPDTKRWRTDDDGFLPFVETIDP